MSHLCPSCGKPLVERHRRYDNKPFLACTGYPLCHYTADIKSGPTQAAPAAPAAHREWSSYQQAIFSFITSGSGNAVVTAVAGSGKTTTLEHMVSLVPSNQRLAFVAFNRSIANELRRRLPPNPSWFIGTLHSLGLRCITAVAPSTDVDDKKSQVLFKMLAEQISGEGFREAVFALNSEILKIASLLRATQLSLDPPSVIYLMERYGITIDAEYSNYTDEIIDFCLRLVMECRQLKSIIDYDDMIDFPAIGIVPTEKFSWIFVDEAQDLNVNQISFILRSLAENGRIIAVGDPAQSIYGFRGADTEAIPRLMSALNAQRLPLSITYRCPTSHVKLAQRFVPEIEARPDAPEGIVSFIPYNALLSVVKPGDLVLCRVNAPLASPCYELIAAGVKATIQGRDIGSGLSALIKRVAKKNKIQTVDSLLYALRELRDREVVKLVKAGKGNQAITLSDKVETIIALSSGVKTIEELETRISIVFSEETAGVVFSSIHRAKGLEAERVFILRPDLMPHPMATQDWEIAQERNINYVALTRSKRELYFVEVSNER